jgi:hypothetical protein
MASAFQADAFQNTAFQTVAVPVEIPEMPAVGPPLPPRRGVDVILHGELFIVRCSLEPGRASSPISLEAGTARGNAIAANAQLDAAVLVMLTGKAYGEHYIGEEELMLLAEAA